MAGKWTPSGDLYSPCGCMCAQELHLSSSPAQASDCGSKVTAKPHLGHRWRNLRGLEISPHRSYVHVKPRTSMAYARAAGSCQRLCHAALFIICTLIFTNSSWRHEIQSGSNELPSLNTINKKAMNQLQKKKSSVCHPRRNKQQRLSHS